MKKLLLISAALTLSTSFASAAGLADLAGGGGSTTAAVTYTGPIPNMANVSQTVYDIEGSVVLQGGQISQRTPHFTTNWATINQNAIGVVGNSVVLQGAAINQGGPIASVPFFNHSPY